MDVKRLGSVLGRRSSRRAALKYTGAGLGVAALGSSFFGQAVSAQDATPAPEIDHLGYPEGQRTFFLFVQTARGGTWEPKPGEEGVYTLTLTGLPAQTVYFSDRPERIVGTQTTAEFLQALGFSEENPPNAALVTKAEDGADDILVIELFNPVFTEAVDETGATLVYEARILENYHETEMGGVALQQDDSSIPSSFDHASLFIDDCADGLATCEKGGQHVGTARFGCCYHFPSCRACWDVTGACSSLVGCEDGSCHITKVSKDCSIFSA